MFVIITGVQTPGDTRILTRHGVDAAGLLVSVLSIAPRGFIDVKAAQRVGQGLGIERVLVTHLSDPELIRQLAMATDATMLSLFGEVPPEGIGKLRLRLGVKVIKPFPIIEPFPWEYALQCLPHVDYVGLDTYNPNTGQFGGTGQLPDLRLTKELAARLDRPLVYGGGLKADNIRHVVELLKPAGVEISSSVKRAGRVDESLLRPVMQALNA